MRLPRLWLAVLILTLGCAGAYQVGRQIESGLNSIPMQVTKDIYRWRQPEPESLDEFIREKEIRSVINLSRPMPGEEWFEKEVAVIKRYNLNADSTDDVNYYALDLLASMYPRPGKVQSILKVIDEAPKPAVFYCNHGRDRTGFISSLILLERGVEADALPEDAEGAIGQGVLWAVRTAKGTGKLNKVLEAHLEDGGDVRQWFTEEYPSVYEGLPEDEKLPLGNPGERVYKYPE